ncbi:MAG: hypothetical protein K8F30_07580, partial [Taibaiella sp.]|nr:hypothetical protein [Taibaiella sp.]
MKLPTHILLFYACLCLPACRHDKYQAPASGTAANNYPDAVKNILVNKCATAGCHNEASYTAAGGLRLDSWEHLFDGGNNGAVVVPYNTGNSSLLYFVNTFPE